jgi:hypothetical protein
MNRALFVLSLLLALTTFAFSDIITFTVVGTGSVDFTAGLAGMMAGPADVTLVTDVSTGKSFPLSDTFHASAGAAHSITIGATSYTAFFSPGATDSVDIPGVVTGNMLDESEATAVTGGAGSFSGEFEVTFVSPAILAELGVGPKWNPTGSVGVTFHESTVNGHTLTGEIGGGSTTVLTVATPIPEPMPLVLLSAGVLILSLRGIRRIDSPLG